jgi:hypothetical protein
MGRTRSEANQAEMTVIDGQSQVPSFLTVTRGILILFLGKALNQRLRLLRQCTIPEAAACWWPCCISSSGS